MSITIISEEAFRVKRLYRLLAAAFVLSLLLCSCSTGPNELQDGYYMAQAAEYDSHGWKDFVTICVRDNRIVAVDYNAKNAYGFIKTWDMEYMRVMKTSCGTYPTEFNRAYTEDLLSLQSPLKVDAISGATVSHGVFQQLAEAALKQARAGDKAIAQVEFPE